MRKYIISLTALLLLWISSTLLMAETKEREVAIATRVQKKVEITRKKQNETVVLKSGDYLYEGDYIKTGKGASVDISFITGIVVNLKEDTEIEIKLTSVEEEGKDTKLELFRGKMFNRIRKLSNLEIQTPQAIAAVRGTEFGMDVGVKTRIYVLEGIVDVWNAQGKVQLEKGMETSVDNGKAPEAPTEIKAKKEVEEEKLDELRLTVDGQLIASKALKLELSVLKPAGGDLDWEYSDKLLVRASRDMIFSKNGKKWDSMPAKLKIVNGKASFYVLKISAGKALLSCTAPDTESTSLELNFRDAQEKELFLDIDDSGIKRKLKLRFEKQ